jgi:hypothetical protein
MLSYFLYFLFLRLYFFFSSSGFSLYESFLRGLCRKLIVSYCWCSGDLFEINAIKMSYLLRVTKTKE